MTRKIVFEAEELADAYALKTLYDYLKERNFEEKTGVGVCFDQFGLKPYSSILKGCNLDESFSDSSTSLYVKTYSDFSGRNHAGQSLFIDISILKNCALSKRDNLKNKLREIAGIKTTLPVLVVSYANIDNVVVDKLINENKEFSEICIMDGPYMGDMGNNIHLVNIFGVLREYYAIADVAVNARNLNKSGNFLHNFVEATEGGPLFMVPPNKERQKQFGYKELSDLEVIRNCKTADDLTAKISKYLNRPIKQIRKEKEEHCNRRTEHIMQTREKYLPIIESEIEKMLAGEYSSSGELIIKNQGSGRILQHPDSWWN